MEPDEGAFDPDAPAFERGDEDRLRALEVVIDWWLQVSHESIGGYDSRLWSQNPGISDEDLVREIVRRKTLKNGLLR
ncbi:MAG: hypothetical protein JXA57_08060 [Armatimonadetes bacterium]|nr:hypothetical protein [Armatimonadota bacterium]